MRLIAIGLTFAFSLHAQWVLQDSHTDADLRGIHAVSKQVGWASGTRGAVLRTVDGGQTWLACAVPVGAERLDFRAVQAFDRNTALVMSAGKGDLSRVYRTTDGCRTWQLVFSNPDKDGFWDAMRFSGKRWGMVAGDPVGGFFALFETLDGGSTWQRTGHKIVAGEHQSLFAASNSCLLLNNNHHRFWLVTGGGTNELLSADRREPFDMAKSESAGGFSLAAGLKAPKPAFVVVGGDYRKPNATEGAAGRWTDGKFSASESMPHGYRSSVAFDPSQKRFIAVGTNGTDISADEGRTWQALEGEGPWNAVSLPFVVGPKGRIGRLQ